LAKLRSKFDIVEDFAVEDQYVLLILTNHGLMARFGQIKNRKTTKSHSHGTIQIDATVIGASMKQTFGHPLNGHSLDGPSIQPYSNRNPTHNNYLLPLPFLA
jgi:hypothetical protein